MDATTDQPGTPVEEGSAPPLYRLPADATATALGPNTVRLRAGTASVLLDGDAESVLAAAESLTQGVPAAMAPPVVEQLWAHGVLQREDGVPADQRRRTRLSLACVLVDGLSGPGARLAELLVQQAVGTVVLRDGSPVTAGDEVPFLPRHQGRPRAEALAELLSGAEEATTVLACPPDGAVRGADLQILVRDGVAGGAWWPPRAQLETLLQETRRVLPVSAQPQGLVLGPVIATGGPAPCPECLERHEAAAPGVGESPTHAADWAQRPPAESSRLSGRTSLVDGMAAHLLAHQVVELLAGELLPTLADTALYADGATGAISSHPVAPSSDCLCRAQSEVFGESPSSSEPVASSDPLEAPGPS